jgi:uncharacterized membrane protein YeaQ/YmgE (transglycosylase-associated protein family)
MLCVGEIMNPMNFEQRLPARLLEPGPNDTKSFVLRRLRRAMLIFWLPLVLLAVIPVVIVLFASVPSGIIWIITIGFVAGVIARLLVPGPNDTKSFVLTTLLGIAGAFTATFIGESIGWFRLDQGAGLIIGAMIGALIFLFIWNQVERALIHHSS